MSNMVQLEVPNINKILTDFVSFYKRSVDRRGDIKRIVSSVVNFINETRPPNLKIVKSSKYYNEYEKQYNIYLKRKSGKDKNTMVFGKTFLFVIFKELRNDCVRQHGKRHREAVERFFKSLGKYLKQDLTKKSSSSSKSKSSGSRKRKRDPIDTSDEEYVPSVGSSSSSSISKSSQNKRAGLGNIRKKRKLTHVPDDVNPHLPQVKIVPTHAVQKKKDEPPKQSFRLPPPQLPPPKQEIKQSSSKNKTPSRTQIVAPPPPSKNGKTTPGKSSKHASKIPSQGTPTPAQQLEIRRAEVARRVSQRSVNLSELVRFRFVKNDSKLCHLELLCAVKNVYSLMLPNMPKDYTSRLVFQRTHVSLVGILAHEVMSGITFRPFPEQGFIEIAFVAVHTKLQVRGVGARMMNHLKDWCQRNGFFRMLTCADNFAVGYFKKQGFSEEITLPKKRYNGYIKSYDSVTLMECIIRPGIPYLAVRRILEVQKQAVNKEMKRINSTKQVYPGLRNFFPSKKSKKSLKRNKRSVLDIPGLKEAGWKPPKINKKEIKSKMIKVVDHISSIPPAWPFKDPVSPRDVPDYYKVIKRPMDLKTLKANVKKGKYKKNIKKFHDDMLLIFSNCREYNAKFTSFYKCADDCEEKYLDFIKRAGINLYHYF